MFRLLVFWGLTYFSPSLVSTNDKGLELPLLSLKRKNTILKAESSNNYNKKNLTVGDD